MDPACAQLLDAVALQVQRRAGLAPPRWQLGARCAELAAAEGRALPECLAGLCRGGDGLERLIEALRVGETRFFRHPEQMLALERRVLPARLRAAADEGRALRVWCAGCASGEEAWSVAMLLAGLRGAGPVPLVLGTDLSAAAVA